MTTPTTSPTYVLVHGSHCNSFGWAPLQRELALRGLRSLAVDLPGHGFAATFPLGYQAPQDQAALTSAPSTMAGARYADAVAHVLATVRQVREHGPVVLVGHSRGGTVLTGVGNAAPDLLARMVYVSAWCCVTRTPPDYLAEPENATSVLAEAAGVVVADPAALGVLRMNWRTADPALLASLKDAVLADGTDDEFRAYLNTMEPDDSLDTGGPDDRARADTWGRVPRSYVRLTEDRSLPLALQDRFIREADALTPDNPFQVRSLPVSHGGALVRPGPLADVLAGLAPG